MKEKYMLTKKDEILIYGAGNFGKKRMRHLISSGYNVIGMIDQQAATFSKVDKVQVYTVREASIVYDTKKVIIIICVHNALWHVDIASDLYLNGFTKIIFLPLDNRFTVCNKKSMESVYMHFTYHNYNYMRDIPTYEKLIEKKLSFEDSIIRDLGDKLVIWISLEEILTNNILDNFEGLTSKYGNIHIAAMKPYIDLFNYCKNGSGNIENYCHAFKSVQNTVDIYTHDEFIKDRVDLYWQLKKEFQSGLDYFINAAPELKWNDQEKSFNIMEGHHRLVFLLLEGLVEIPVVVSRKDFLCWVNEGIFNNIPKLRNHIIENGWETPINHPALKEIKTMEGIQIQYILLHLESILNSLNIDEFSISDLTFRAGYFSRVFQKKCKKEIKCYEKDKDKIPLIQSLNKLLYTDKTILIHGTIENYLKSNYKDNLVFLKIDKSDFDYFIRKKSEVFEHILNYIIIEFTELEDIKNVTKDSKFKHTYLIGEYMYNEGLKSVWLLSTFEIEEDTK